MFSGDWIKQSKTVAMLNSVAITSLTYQQYLLFINETEPKGNKFTGTSNGTPLLQTTLQNNGAGNIVLNVPCSFSPTLSQTCSEVLLRTSQAAKWCPGEKVALCYSRIHLCCLLNSAYKTYPSFIWIWHTARVLFSNCFFSIHLLQHLSM